MKNDNQFPLVSVCIAAYNHEKYILETIQSVINQKYKNLELIIINDGSKDNTDKIIRDYNDIIQSRFVRYEYVNRANKGVSATLNECLNWAEGDFFTGIASDDVMLPERISTLLNVIKKLDKSYAAVFGNAFFIDENSRIISLNDNGEICRFGEKCYGTFLDFILKKRDFEYDSDEFGSYRSLLRSNYLPSMSCLMRTDIIKQVGGWQEDKSIEDWALWLTLSKDYKMICINEPISQYRWHETNTSKVNRKKLIFDSMKLLKEEMNYAFKSGLQYVYYESLIALLYSLRGSGYVVLIRELVKNFQDYRFAIFMLKKILKKVKNALA